MTQEKQTSIRILQSKPVKKTLGKSSFFLIGLFVGIISTALFFFVFFNFDRTQEDMASGSINAEDNVHATSSETPQNHEDDDAHSYKQQHLNEKDFNNIFKHDRKSVENQNTNKSPFEQILSPEDKKTQPVPHKAPLPPLAKPIEKAGVKKAEEKPKLESKPEVKETPIKKDEVKEISPEGSVKVSINSRETENKP